MIFYPIYQAVFQLTEHVVVWKNGLNVFWDNCLAEVIYFLPKLMLVEDFCWYIKNISNVDYLYGIFSLPPSLFHEVQHQRVW